MQHMHPTIGEVSRQILQNFTRRELNDGRRIWGLEKEIEWQHQIVQNALDESIVTSEVYSSIFRILLEIFVANSQEEAEEFLLEIEPSSDIKELTGWLHSSEKNIEYITRALRLKEITDGVSVLAEAQKIFLQEVGARVISEIQRYIQQKEFATQTLN